MSAEIEVTTAVERAQRILAEHIEPGPRDCDATINKLLDVLDDGALIEAVDEVKHERRSEEPRSAGPGSHRDDRAA
jgi:hypothetical protein